MNELQMKIVGLVEKAGTSITWESLMNGLDYREQQQALKMIRPLQKQGIIDREVKHDKASGKVVLTIKRGKTKIESST